MNAFDQQQIEELFAAYHETRAEALRTRERIAGISVSAAAPRQTVRVTVDGLGAITALEFPTHAYRKMAPAELSEAILRAVADARAQVLNELAALSPASGLLSGVVNPADLLAGRADVARLLPEDPAAAAPFATGLAAPASGPGGSVAR